MNIRRLLREVDDAHREAMGPVPVAPDTDTSRSSRRRFLGSVGLGGAALLGATAAPGLVLGGAAGAQQAGTGDAPAIPEGDLQTVLYAQGLEYALADAYQFAIGLRLLNPELTEMARIFRRHHGDHGLALGTVAGQPEDEPVTTPNQALLARAEQQLGATTSQDGLLRALMELEQSAAATYAGVMGRLEAPPASARAASIGPIEAQHATAIALVLNLPADEYLPAFQTTTGAFDPATYPA